MKLANFTGNLPVCMEKHPEATAFFELKASGKMKFVFPKPSFFIEGIKSRGNATFGYPTSTFEEMSTLIANIDV